MRSSVLVRLMSIVGAVAVIGAAAGIVYTTTQAGPVAGEYSIETNIASTTSVGTATFQVVAAMQHTAGTQDCSAGEGQYGCYQAVQWFIEYDEALVDLGANGVAGTAANAIAKVAAAPSQCISKADNGTRVLLGCLDLGGPMMNYSGNFWNMNFFCIANGTATFETFGPGTNSYVRVGAVNQPLHVHSDTIECTGFGTPDTPTPVATNTAPATNTPVPTNTTAPPATNTPVPTNTTAPPATNTPVPTNTTAPPATNTPVPTNTTAPPATNTPLPTNTTVPGATNTPVPTNTTAPPATNTPVPTNTTAPPATNTPVPTNTTAPPATNTPQPTNTRTPTATTAPPTVTRTPTATATTGTVPTATNTRTATATVGGGNQTPVSTRTPRTATPTRTRTATPRPSTSTPTPVVDPVECGGDMNGDGRITGKDILLLIKAIRHQDLRGDLNGDRVVDFEDVIVLLRSLTNPECRCPRDMDENRAVNTVDVGRVTDGIRTQATGADLTKDGIVSMKDVHIVVRSTKDNSCRRW